jgi:hypothetical protein
MNVASWSSLTARRPFTSRRSSTASFSSAAQRDERVEEDQGTPAGEHAAPGERGVRTEVDATGREILGAATVQILRHETGGVQAPAEIGAWSEIASPSSCGGACRSRAPGQLCTLGRSRIRGRGAEHVVGRIRSSAPPDPPD